jgi:hypothetical protein
LHSLSTLGEDTCHPPLVLQPPPPSPPC